MKKGVAELDGAERRAHALEHLIAAVIRQSGGNELRIDKEHIIGKVILRVSQR